MSNTTETLNDLFRLVYSNAAKEGWCPLCWITLARVAKKEHARFCVYGEMLLAREQEVPDV